MHFPRFVRPLILTIAGATLAACGGSSGGGGGGGGGGTPTPPPAATPPTTITASNAPVIVSAVYAAVVTIDDIGGLTNPANIAEDGGATANAKSQSSVAAIDPNGDVIEDCTESGRLSLTLSDTVIQNLEAGALAPGDAIDFGFEACDDGEGLITDGSFSITVVDFEGDIFSQLYLLDADVTMDPFQVTVDAETTTLNADMAILVDQRNLPIVGIAVASGIDGFIDEETSATGHMTTLTNFTIATEIDETTPTNVIFTTTGNGAMTSSEFEGEVTFEITVAIQNVNEDNPTVGTLVIDGEDSSGITLTAIDELTVQIDVVLADGTELPTEIVPWSDLVE